MTYNDWQYSWYLDFVNSQHQDLKDMFQKIISKTISETAEKINRLMDMDKMNYTDLIRATGEVVYNDWPERPVLWTWQRLHQKTRCEILSDDHGVWWHWEPRWVLQKEYDKQWRLN